MHKGDGGALMLKIASISAASLERGAEGVGIGWGAGKAGCEHLAESAGASEGCGFLLFLFILSSFCFLMCFSFCFCMMSLIKPVLVFYCTCSAPVSRY